MPLNPFHNDSTRPPDGAFGVVCEIGVLEAKQTVGAALAAMLLLWFLRSALPSTNRLDNAVPESRQEAERRCCGEGRRHAGPWMARLADPRSSAGTRGVERSETRMSGALSLWLLSLLREPT